MKSLEEQIVNLQEVAKRHGRGDEALAIITEKAKPLEYKLERLVQLTRPFVESLNESHGSTPESKLKVVEAAQKAFGMTLAQARKFAEIDSYDTANDLAESVRRWGE